MSHQAPCPFFMPPAFYYQQAAPGSAPPPPPPPFYFYNAPAAPAPPPPPPTFCYAPVAPAPPPPPALGAVPIRQVWARNLDAEMDALLAFATRASHVAVNVQYPGVIVQADAADQKDPAFVTTEKWYALLKSNVDALKPLQIGLAVLRDDGQIMSWEFNLRGFDPATDPHSAHSVAYLASRGMDLDAHRARGVPVARLGMLLHHSALLRRPGLRWVMHAGEYHVAFLLKVITGGQPMPGDVHGLRALAMRFLCGGVKDVKHMAARHPGLPVGLERIAGALGLAPPPGRPCLAGSRAVLAMQVFILLGSSSFYPRFAPCSGVQM